MMPPVVVKSPCQVTGLMPPGSPPAGTGNATPERNTLSEKLAGTVVTHFPPLNVVVALLAEVEKTISLSGTDTVYGVPFAEKVIFWLRNWIVPPLLAPLGFSTLLNQIVSPPGFAVPLKFDSMRLFEQP